MFHCLGNRSILLQEVSLRAVNLKLFNRTRDFRRYDFCPIDLLACVIVLS